MRWFLRAYAAAGLLMASFAGGQSSGVSGEGVPVSPAPTVIDVLHEFSDKADVIFAGQVVAIRRPNPGVVEVEFRVDQAIRGCAVGTPYVMREWAGLWAGGTQRYRVGQRLLMLLHAPSAAGMSSPVGGLDGAIPIRQGGPGLPVSADEASSQPPYVDLRWLGARVPHAVSYRSEQATGRTTALLTPGLKAQVAVSGSIVGSAPIGPALNVSSSDASVPAQQASITAVVGMLQSWQKVQHVVP
jgi:hypothetical protein